ncbi:MAG: thioesterase [Oscillospiraceae bacterium]|nr:thioesterase [Oscillospiraceae bacterium]
MENIKLFCIPHAGGSAAMYLKLKPFLSEFIELIPVELAGRGNRFSDRFYESFDEAANDIYRFIFKRASGAKYAIFGHSMGGWLSFNICDKILKSEKPGPIHVFLSGRYPPHIKYRGEFMHKMSDEELIENIISFGGMSNIILKDKELLNYFLRIIRADYRILETHKPLLDFKFTNDITVIRGKNDSIVSDIDVGEWDRYTTKKCKMKEFEGGHFYIENNANLLSNFINSILSEYL